MRKEHFKINLLMQSNEYYHDYANRKYLKEIRRIDYGYERF